MKRSRPPREVKFGYNPDMRSLNYRFVNARNGASGPSDSKGLADARARGFSEHPRRSKRAPAQLSPMCTFSVGIVAMALLPHPNKMWVKVSF